MKRIIFASFFFLIFAASFAQKPVLQYGGFTGVSMGKAATDTLWPGNSLSASDFVLVEDSLGGYVLGTNSYHSIAIGQRFPVTTSYMIESAFFWFGYKKVVADDSITFAVWRMDSLNGYTMAGENQPGPGTVLTSFRTSLSQVDTASSLGGAYFVTFDQPVIVIDDYVIGFGMSSFTTDSLGMISTANGDGNGNELVWEQWGINHTWHTLQASGWGFPALLDVDAMILPVVDMTNAGIQQAPVLNGLSCNLWPNPAHRILHLEVTAAEASSQCSVQIMDASGKIVNTHNNSGLQQGINNLEINLETLATGTYFCLVTSGNAKYALKFMVEE